MIDLEKAMNYVQSHGNAVDQARLAAILWDEPPPEAALQKLAALQKPDGGFSYWLPGVSNVWESENGEAFAVSATVEALRVLKGYGQIGVPHESF